LYKIKNKKILGKRNFKQEVKESEEFIGKKKYSKSRKNKKIDK